VRAYSSAAETIALNNIAKNSSINIALNNLRDVPGAKKQVRRVIPPLHRLNAPSRRRSSLTHAFCALTKLQFPHNCYCGLLDRYRAFLNIFFGLIFQFVWIGPFC
jgi:hypothetical protein